MPVLAFFNNNADWSDLVALFVFIIFIVLVIDLLRILIAKM